MSDCLFCKIAAGEIPSTCLYSDEQVYAFQDIDPQAPTHFLVIPRKHIASLAELHDTDAQLAGHCLSVIAQLAGKLGLDGFRVVSNCGESAGQTVQHLHFHVLAGRSLAWPPG